MGPKIKALLVLLAAFVILGYAKASDLRRHMPYEIILIIASALVISEVMISTRAAELLASGLLTGAGNYGPYWALAVVLVVTWILTELMSNNAAAALAFPVGLGVATQLGLDPKPFVMAVLYGASCSFVTPYRLPDQPDGDDSRTLQDGRLCPCRHTGSTGLHDACAGDHPYRVPAPLSGTASLAAQTVRAQDYNPRRTNDEFFWNSSSRNGEGSMISSFLSTIRLLTDAVTHPSPNDFNLSNGLRIPGGSDLYLSNTTI